MKQKFSRDDLAKFFHSKKALAVADKQDYRVFFRTLFKSLDISTENIFLAGNIQNAQTIIAEQKPEIILTECNVEKGSGLSLLPAHQKLFFNRSSVVFCVASEEQGPEVREKLTNGEIDGFLEKPYTPSVIEEAFLDSIKHKIKPTKYFMALERAKEMILRDDLEKALKALEIAQKCSNKPADALCYEGLIYRKQNKDEQALKCFISVMKILPTHYLCLNEVMDIFLEKESYESAYKIKSTLMQHYPVNPGHLDKLLDLSMKLEKHEDAILYADTFLSAHIDNLPMQRKLVEFILASAPSLLKEGKKEEVDKLLQQVIDLSENKEPVLSKVVKIYKKLGGVDKAQEVLKDVKERVGSEVLIDVLELELLDSSKGDSSYILNLGMDVLKRGGTSVSVYKILIKHSKKVGRRQDLIDDLIFEAIKHHPEKKSTFEKMKQ